MTLSAGLQGIGLAVFLALAASPAEGQGQKTADRNDTFTFDNNEPPSTENRLAPFLFWGGKLEIELESENNYDLDDEKDEDVTTVEPSLELALSYIPSPNFDAYVNFELIRDFAIEDDDDDERPTRLNVKEAYVTLRHPTENLSLKVGRQRFDDEREWLYDEELDAMRLFYGGSSFGLEASVSRQRLFDKDLLNREDKDRINNYVVLGRYRPNDDIAFEAYAIARDDRDTGERPLFLGVSTRGEAIENLDYWAEFAYVTGKGEVDKATGDRLTIQGFGGDIGATYVLDTTLEPSITVGYAYGSGDDDFADGEDGNFRQTGLQDNNDRFNGIASFKYYGELVEPELSNLTILTAGLGIRPTEQSSIDLVYHHYRQNAASDEIRDSNLDEDPSGNSRDLGREIDLIAGYRGIPNMGIELVLGYFTPGAAFENDDDDAFFVGTELIYRF